MTRRSIFLGIFIVLIFAFLLSSFFYVEQRTQALVLQFGEPIRVIKDPGLKFKIPFISFVG